MLTASISFADEEHALCTPQRHTEHKDMHTRAAFLGLNDKEDTTQASPNSVLPEHDEAPLKVYSHVFVKKQLLQLALAGDVLTAAPEAWLYLHCID